MMALLLPSQEEEAVEGFPVGFRFCPTDLDLVDFYLRKRKQGCPNPDLFIQELDIYKYRPWNLPHYLFPYRSEDWEMYFFTKRRRAGRKPKSVSRTVDEGGVWDCHAKEAPVYKQVVVRGENQQPQRASVKIGCSLQFNFKLFEPAGDKKRNKVKTAWIMHEYRLFESADDNDKFDELVLCKISNKRGKKGEEEEEVIAPPLNLQLVDEALAVQTLSPLQRLMEGSSNDEALRGRGCFKRRRVEAEGAADDDAGYFAAIGSLEECVEGVDQQQFTLIADQSAAASVMPPKEEIQETMLVGAAAAAAADGGDAGDELFSPAEDVDFDNIDADLCCRLLDECLQDDFLVAIGQGDHKY